MTVDDLGLRRLRQVFEGPGAVIRTGPFNARLGAAIGELTDAFRTLYGDYPVLDGSADDEIIDFDIRVVPTSGVRRWLWPRVTCLVDGRHRFLPLPRAQALAMFEWAFNWCVFSRPNAWLILHSGVVERNGCALLLSGSPGAGKSTLAAGLCLRGWRLLSDEVALIRPGTRSVTPVPRPVGLKEESIGVIRAFDSRAVIGPTCTGTRKGTVAHMRPPADSVARGLETAEVRWILFPTWARGEPARLTPIPRAEALLRTGREAFNYSLLGESGFETLAGIVDRCECLALRYGDLEQAARLLTELADGAAPATLRRSVEADR